MNRKQLSMPVGVWALLVGLVLFAWMVGPMRTCAQQQTTDVKDVFGGNGQIAADSIEFTTGKDGKVDTLTARKKVVLTSDKMNTACDVLTYDVSRNRMIAVGSPVHITQEDGRAICKNFEYHPSDGKAVLTGDPEVWQKTKDREVHMTGDIIRMDRQADGRMHFFVDHGDNPGRATVKLKDIISGNFPKSGDKVAPGGVRQPSLEMATGSEKPKKEKPEPPEAVKLDKSNVNKIPEPQIENE